MKNNRSNLSLSLMFSVISLLTLTCMNQQLVYGQTPPPVNAPVTPRRQPTPKPATTNPANPARQLPGSAIKNAPANPNKSPLPKATKVPPPDLYIKDVKFSEHDDSGSVLIANRGPGNAGGFKMVYELISETGTIYAKLTNAVGTLPNGNERWIPIKASSMTLQGGPYRANKIRFALIAPYEEARIDNNQSSTIVPKSPAPNYFPTEMKSEYRIIHVRIENKGPTVIKPGTEVFVTLSILVKKSDGGWGHTQCAGVDVKGDPAFGEPTTCYAAKTSVTAPIKPGQSGWAVASFALLGHDFNKMYEVMNKIISGWNDQKKYPLRYSGVIAHVKGGSRGLAMPLNNNFFGK